MICVQELLTVPDVDAKVCNNRGMTPEMCAAEGGGGGGKEAVVEWLQRSKPAHLPASAAESSCVGTQVLERAHWPRCVPYCQGLCHQWRYLPYSTCTKPSPLPSTLTKINVHIIVIINTSTYLFQHLWKGMVL